MKLEKFRKNNKSRNIIIALSAIILILGGVIYVYRSYALYEEKRTFNIIRGQVPEFSASTSSIEIAYTVLGDPTNDPFPNKGSGFTGNGVTCKNGVSAEWDDANWALKIIDSNGSTKISCNVDFASMNEFDYTGEIQEFVVPIDGVYKLEVWGAQGGGYNSTNCIGGYGAYSSGNVILTKGTILYIVVAGKGLGDGTRTYRAGGYNGGGYAGVGSDYNSRTSSGGGATHIATISGLLSELENYTDEILIVASGGGSGAANNAVGCARGGDGGGIQGNNGSTLYGDSVTHYGIGATQTSGGSYYVPAACNTGLCINGSFGLGACGDVSGGGGGFYGGGKSAYSGGGGSSYIGNPLLTDKSMYCYNCTESDEETTKTISTTDVFEEPISQSAKIGNGYAKVTCISKSS